MNDNQIVKLNSFIKDIAAGPFGSNLKVECFVQSGFPIIDGANLKGVNVTKFVTCRERVSARCLKIRYHVI